MTSPFALIRAASQAYVADMVDLSILNIEPAPAAGDQINPGDEFTFSVKATNAPEADGGLRLVDLVWHVWLDTNTQSGDPTWLRVPDPPLDAYNRIDRSIQWNPGAHTTVMYVFPQEGRSVLDVGETNRLDLTAVATGLPGGEDLVVHFELYGTVDLGSLTPQSQAESPSRTIEIVP